jgi:hypothetical protein
LSISEGEQKAIQVGRTVLDFQLSHKEAEIEFNPFKDITASNLFDNKIPYFGVKEEVKEDVDLPAQDRIQNLVPSFLVHPNTSVMKGNLLPRNEYIHHGVLQ